MILADSSVWADHIREPNAQFQAVLDARLVLVHSAVIGELAMGNLPRRTDYLRFLHRLPAAEPARDVEVLRMVEENRLNGSGIGWIDAHLAASARLSQAALWTLDKRLHRAAQTLNLPTNALH